MGIGYNLALSRLPEYLFKLNNRKALRCYYVFKNISWSNTWKLVNITYKYKSCSNCYCFKKRIHNININHWHLIYNYYICFQRVVFISVKAHSKAWCLIFLVFFISHSTSNYFKKSVNCLCLKTTRFCHSLGSSSRRCRKPYLKTFHLKIFNYRINCCCLTGSRSTCYYNKSVKCSFYNSFFLYVIKHNALWSFNPCYSVIDLVDIFIAFYIKSCQCPCNILFHIEIHRRIHIFRFPLCSYNNLLIYSKIHKKLIIITNVNKQKWWHLPL